MPTKPGPSGVTPPAPSLPGGRADRRTDAKLNFPAARCQRPAPVPKGPPRSQPLPLAAGLRGGRFPLGPPSRFGATSRSGLQFRVFFSSQGSVGAAGFLTWSSRGGHGLQNRDRPVGTQVAPRENPPGQPHHTGNGTGLPKLAPPKRLLLKTLQLHYRNILNLNKTDFFHIN